MVKKRKNIRIKSSINYDIASSIINKLNIHHKENAVIIKKRYFTTNFSGNKIRIIKIIPLFDENDDIIVNTRCAKNICLNLYTSNIKGHIIVNNLYTNIKLEIGRMGINKTFSKNVPFEKLSTTNILKKIVQHAVYVETSYDTNDKCGILYHHFITFVTFKSNNKIQCIRTVFKEYTKDQNLNIKFYYHQFEDIN